MSVEALQKRWICRSNGNEADECWQTQSTKYKLKSGIKSETKSETKSKLIKFATLRTYPPTFPFPVSKVTWQCVLHRAPCLRECAIFFIRRRCLWLSRSRRLEADPSILYGSAAMLKWPATPALLLCFLQLVRRFKIRLQQIIKVMTQAAPLDFQWTFQSLPVVLLSCAAGTQHTLIPRCHTCAPIGSCNLLWTVHDATYRRGGGQC